MSLPDIDQVIDEAVPEKWVSDVEEFNVTKLPFLDLSSVPCLPTWEDRVYLLASLQSEQSELSHAFATSDVVEMVDALLDSIYVQLGILIKCGIPIEACWEEVQRSNMAKDPAAPGTMGRRTASGGSMKPPGWVAPRIKEIIEKVTQNYRDSKFDLH